MTAGKLPHRVTFESPADADDGHGGTVIGWADMFTRWAGYQFVKGGEGVMAGRLEGKQPVIFTIRSDTQTETITTDWRATDTRTGAVYNIRGTARSEDRAWIELTAESGVAT